MVSYLRVLAEIKEENSLKVVKRFGMVVVETKVMRRVRIRR